MEAGRGGTAGQPQASSGASARNNNRRKKNNNRRKKTNNANPNPDAANGTTIVAGAQMNQNGAANTSQQAPNTIKRDSRASQPSHNMKKSKPPTNVVQVVWNKIVVRLERESDTEGESGGVVDSHTYRLVGSYTFAQLLEDCLRHWGDALDSIAKKIEFQDSEGCTWPLAGVIENELTESDLISFPSASSSQERKKANKEEEKEKEKQKGEEGEDEKKDKEKEEPRPQQRRGSDASLRQVMLPAVRLVYRPAATTTQAPPSKGLATSTTSATIAKPASPPSSRRRRALASPLRRNILVANTTATSEGKPTVARPTTPPTLPRGIVNLSDMPSDSDLLKTLECAASATTTTTTTTTTTITTDETIPILEEPSGLLPPDITPRRRKSGLKLVKSNSELCESHIFETAEITSKQAPQEVSSLEKLELEKTTKKKPKD